jgi:hypothetical protein
MDVPGSLTKHNYRPFSFSGNRMQNGGWARQQNGMSYAIS